MTISLTVPGVLVTRARTGDLEALEALYRAFETPVYNVARRILHLWGWIRRIAASKALMRIRREQVRATEEFEEAATGGRPAAHVGTNIDLERALKQLTGTARAVVWLHDVEGYTHEEIAELMGKTVSFSKSQLARAHARLRRTLEPGLEGA